MIRGIFDNENIKEQIKELEQISLQENSKDKNLVKNSKTKNF